MGCKHSNRQARSQAQGYWELIAAGEPYRLLFPVGLALGVIGVLMWPSFFYHYTEMYPGQAHARVMIQGFLGCFVIGFLGTALPRLLDVKRLQCWETCGYAALLLSVALLHSGGYSNVGDGLFLLTMVLFVTGLAARLPHRKDTPPPGFVLVALGMLSAMAGTAGFLLFEFYPLLLPDWSYMLFRRLMYQGFLLFPIMGIGAFLLPRFFDLPNRQNFPESLSLPKGWLRSAMFALACGLTVMAGFILESLGQIPLGNGLKAIAVLVYLLREVPVHKAKTGGGSLALALRISLFAIPLGLALVAIFPNQILSLLHVVYITGFSLLTFTVATRVVLGHSGQSSKFRAKLPSVITITTLLVLSMLTRVAADWLPNLAMSHYSYAAVLWASAAIVWAIYILPGVRKADKE